MPNKYISRILFATALLWSFTSCQYSGKPINDTDENDDTIIASETIGDTSHIYGQHRALIIKSIVDGDKKTFASLVQYPLRRDYPLRDIRNRQQMIDNFDLIFDATFRDTLRTMDSNSWEVIGWRGAMLCDGMIWGDGPVEVINYSSPQEQQFRQKVIAAEMQTLHPSLQGNWQPKDRLLFDDVTYEFARLDVQGEDFYRLTLFKKGAKTGDIPALTLYGKCEIEGSMGIATYSFSNNKGYKAFYSPDQSLYSEGDVEHSQDILSLTMPNGKGLSIKIKQFHYYQPNPLYP